MFFCLLFLSKEKKTFLFLCLYEQKQVQELTEEKALLTKKLEVEQQRRRELAETSQVPKRAPPPWILVPFVWQLTLLKHFLRSFLFFNTTLMILVAF